MADEEQSHFLRSILLLIEGGSYIAREILLRECSKTGRDIGSLIGDFKTKLKHEFHGKQFQKLFPETGETTDINCWDLQLLIGVISIVFRKSISRSEKKDLVVLKQLRNEVFMHCAKASLDEDKYEEVIDQLEDSLNGLASTFEQQVKEICFTFIKTFKSGPLDELRPSFAALNGLILPAQKIFKVGISTVLAVGGPSIEWTDICEQILATIFNNVITETESDTHENVREKVTKMLNFLSANKDNVLKDCVRGCIILEFECNSYDDMLYLLNKLDSWEFRYHLNKISNALTKELKLNGLLTLTLQVTTKSLQTIFIQRIQMLHEEEMSGDCLEISSHTDTGNKDGEEKTEPKEDSNGTVSLNGDVRKPLKLGLECKSQEGMLHILNSFKGNEFQNHLKEVADALTEHVKKKAPLKASLKEKVTLKTSLDIGDFMSSFEESVIAERYKDRQLMTFVPRPDATSVDTQQRDTGSQVTEESIVATKQVDLQSIPAQRKTEYTILFRGIHPETCSGALACVIKDASEGIAENENIIFNHTKSCAVVKVYLSQPPDLDLIRSHLREHCIDDENPDVYTIPPTESIAVSTDEGITNIDCLEYYFESHKNGGYELKQSPYKTEDKSCVILQFGDPEIVKKVCARPEPYIWEGNTLRVSPCYLFDGEVIWDAATHYMRPPRPLTIKLDPNVLKILQRKCCEHLLTELKNNFCVPTFTEIGLELSCSLTTSLVGYKKLAEEWAKSGEHIVDRFIKDHIIEKSFKTSENEWTEVMIYFQSEKIAENVEVVCTIDEMNFAIALLGLRQSVEHVYAILVEKQNQLRQETEVIKIDAHKIRLMRSVGVFEDLKMEMQKIKLEEGDVDIKIRGHSEDVLRTKVKLLEVCSNIENRKVKHNFSKECVKFIKTKLKESLTLHLKSRYTENSVEWDIDFRDIKLYMLEDKKTGLSFEQRQVNEEHKYASDDGRATPEEIIKESILEIHETDPASCDSSNMKTFLKEMNDMYGEHVVVQYSESQGELTIYGLKDEAKLVHSKVKDFLEEVGSRVIERAIERDAGYINFINKHKKDELQIIEKRNAVKIEIGEKRLIISGHVEGVLKTEKTLMAMLDGVICEKMSVQKVGAKVAMRNAEKQRQFSHVGESRGCVIQFPNDTREEEPQLAATELSNAEIDGSDALDRSICGPSRLDQEVPCERKFEIPMERNDTFKTQNGIEVKLVKGELGHQQGDVIVTGTSSDLNLKSGKACQSLLDKSGNVLQEMCRKTYPRGIKTNEIAVIRACGNIACKNVYLTTLPIWTNDNETRNHFKLTMEQTLEIASEEGMKSIVFSALGTGQLKYPKDFVAFLMYDAIVAFDQCHPRTTLKDVRFVLYHKDYATIKAFEEEERIRKENSGRRQILYDLKASEMTIKVCVGDIANQNVDAVFSSSSSTKAPSQKAVIHTLYDEGGNILKEEIESEYRHKLRGDDVAEIQAEKLSCKTVYMATINKDMKEQSKNVMKAIKKVLFETSIKGFTSLAIPASLRDDQGTEIEAVCSDLFDTVIEWAKENTESTLKTVKFVIDPKDSQAAHKFKSYILIKKGLGKRLQRHSQVDRHNSDIETAVGKVRLILQMGNILQQNTDAVVSSVGKDFKLIGSVAYELKHNCPDLEKDIQRKDLVKKLNTEEVVATEVDNLKAKSVIHVQFADNLQDWQVRIRKCLELANEKSYRTISFPVLGTGKGFKTFSPEDITRCLISAVRDFEQSHSSPSIQDVYLIVYEKQPEMYSLLNKIIEAISLEAEAEFAIDEKRVASRLKTLRQFSVKGADSKQGRYASAKLWKTFVEGQSFTEISIYSEERESIKHCKSLLNEEIEEMYITRKLENNKETVKSLTPKQLRDIDMLALADVNIDRKSGIISVYGPKEDVIDVTQEIRTQILKIEDMKPDLATAETLYHQVQWQYEEVTTTGFQFSPYEKLLNYRIEQAYIANFQHFEFEENGESFLVDLQHFEEYRKSNVTDRIRVMRRNILEEKLVSARHQWIRLTGTEIESSFRDEESSFEYDNIFDMKNISILKIEEISETTYHQMYQVLRQMMEQQSKSHKLMKIERDLWYAASYDEVADILEHGFNTSLCGRVSPLHGEGVYFTSDAVHSIRRWLSSDCSSGKGYIFLANVLTGNICEGQKGTRFLPEVDRYNTRCQYDSAVDDEEDPREFIVFSNTLACPRYLITFQYTSEET